MSATVQTDSLVREASAYVYKLFKEKLPATLTYHNYAHTVDVASDADRIGRKSGIPEERLVLVTLAAWFHDTGFIEVYQGHEEVSARIARKFLENHGMPQHNIEKVISYIYATRENYQPVNLEEQVIHDADRAHVGKEKFFDLADQLRREWEHHRGTRYSDQEWAELQLEFLSSVEFYTDFARENFRKQWRRNLESLQTTLAGFLNARQKLPKPKTKKSVASRGIQTMFRSTYRNHINLSSIADSKANIMISVNAILMSIIISFVSTRLQANPWLLTPAGVLLVSSLAATVFAILSARPKVTSKVFTLDDVRRNESNLLFFGNFVNMSLNDFTIGMRELMQDEDTLYNNMIADLHSLGQVLSRKYKLLWISYTVFMAGLSVSVVLFLILFLTST